MTWSRDEHGVWCRSDGMRVVREAGSVRTHYSVVSRLGTVLSQGSNKSRRSQPRRFSTEQAAMKGADEQWPVKGEG